MDNIITLLKNTRTFVLVFMIVSSVLASASLQSVWGHGVSPQFLSSSIHINNEQFSDSTLNTGEQLTVTGEIENLSGSIFRVSSLSLMAESSFDLGQPWEILARDPQSTSFDVPAGETLPYSLTIKVLRPNTYHIHTQVDIQGGQTLLGRGQTVSVSGEPLNGLDQGTSITLMIVVPLAGGAGAGGIILWKIKARKGKPQEKQYQYEDTGSNLRNESSSHSPQTKDQSDQTTSAQEPSLKESKFKD